TKAATRLPCCGVAWLLASGPVSTPSPGSRMSSPASPPTPSPGLPSFYPTTGLPPRLINTKLHRRWPTLPWPVLVILSPLRYFDGGHFVLDEYADAIAEAIIETFSR